ncbi:S66 peptidase family protein [Mycoplasmopsis adleri]|uniref:S66 family peptidase n=1 Tax=Mycoplasmopsis adleri TaxID=51362 RepID=UPI0038737B45
MVKVGNSGKTLSEHPELRTKDLKEAFENKDVNAIICAIGGEDTYRTLPYLMEDQEFKELVAKHPKVFTGFSDSTINHLMFYRLGMSSYYGHNVLCDFAELDKAMLPYTENSYKWLFDNKNAPIIISSDTWYEERNDFSEKSLNTSRISHKDTKGFEPLTINKDFEGELWGGCIESLYDVLTGYRHADAKEICSKYNLLLNKDEFKGKILFLETSENKIEPEVLKLMLTVFKENGFFNNISGLIVGKPQNEAYYEEYKNIYKTVIDENIPVIYNINFGHGYPRTILAYGQVLKYDSAKKIFTYKEPIVK